MTDYGEYVGLMLNMPRVRFKAATLTLLGTAAAGNNESLDLLWFEALAQDQGEAEDLQDAANRERWVRKAMATARRGP